jgi:hypothetical protein
MTRCFSVREKGQGFEATSVPDAASESKPPPPPPPPEDEPLPPGERSFSMSMGRGAEDERESPKRAALVESGARWEVSLQSRAAVASARASGKSQLAASSRHAPKMSDSDTARGGGAEGEGCASAAPWRESADSNAARNRREDGLLYPAVLFRTFHRPLINLSRIVY